MFSNRWARLALGLIAAAFAHAQGSVRISASDANRQPIADLVVWLVPLDAPLPPLPAEGALTATVVQQGEEFHPYILAVRTGTRVFFPNRDNVQHHVYSLARPAQFEIPLHGGDDHESVVMTKPGIVPVGCNIHDWMISNLVVIDSPWFGQTTADGDLTLTDLPVGRYQLSAWHPRLRQAHEQAITVTAATSLPVTLTLKLRPDRRIRRAPDAQGTGY